MDDGEARTMGRLVRQIRRSRRKSLVVVAGLAGMSKSELSRIERGERALDSLSKIVALANALGIAPSELTKLPTPAPANGHTDSAAESVRLALDAIDTDRPGGLVLPLEVLRDRVAQIHRQRRACQAADVATALPGLIRDLHTTLGTGTAHGELLDLAVYLHTHVTRWWMIQSAAPVDLIRRAVFLTRRLAHERDEITTLAMATFGAADTLLGSGVFDLGRAELDSLTLPPITADNAGLVAVTYSAHSMAAALGGRPDDVAAALDVVAELAERFGAVDATDSLGFPCGPVGVGICRMARALDAGEPDQVVRVAQQIQPERHPFLVNRAQYWALYGRALARMRRRQDDAVRALRIAEDIFPARVHRDPLIRDLLAELLTRVRHDSPIGEELRGMAYRSGLPV